MFRLRTRSLPHLAFLFVCALAAVASACLEQARASLVINELLSAPGRDWNADGETDFKNDEWVEILNTGPGVEDLDGVFLRDGTGDTYHYGFSGTLAAGETRVVYGHQAVAWQQSQGLATTGLSLNNGGDRIELWRDVTSPRVLEGLDSVDVPAHAAASDRALGRVQPTLSWSLFDALNPYTGGASPEGTGCAPSPGSTNACEPGLPLRQATWGRLRHEFDSGLPR